MIACGAVLYQLEDRAETTEAGRLRYRTGVAGRVEEELPEVAAWTELTVFRPFERCRARRLSECVGIEVGRAVHRRIVDGDPVRIEHFPIGMQVDLILRSDVRISLARVKNDGTGVCLGHDLQRLQLAAFGQVAIVVGNEAEDEAVGLASVRQTGSGRTERTTCVLDGPYIAIWIGLHALIGGMTEVTGQMLHH